VPTVARRRGRQDETPFDLWATRRPLTSPPSPAVPTTSVSRQGIFTRQLAAFGAKAATWRAAVAAAAELDVLTALALAADGYTDGPTCVPTLLPPTTTTTASSSSDPSSSAGWTASGLRHPCAGVGVGGGGGGGGFVPNDTALGGAAPPFLLLTGPNMGGKSTLLRQVNRLTDRLTDRRSPRRSPLALSCPFRRLRSPLPSRSLYPTHCCKERVTQLSI